jgi:pSer/pThr/pTyr-binding forkhead associated (FHA) protein
LQEQRVAALLVAGGIGHPVFPSPPPAARLIAFEHALLFGRRPPLMPPRDVTVWAVRDGRVSSVHARSEAVDDGYELTDLGSMNGTFVDGVRIEEPVRLREGAVLFFGHQVAVFRTMTGRELEAVRRT